jgi:hypothetical protein
MSQNYAPIHIFEHELYIFLSQPGAFVEERFEISAVQMNDHLPPEKETRGQNETTISGKTPEVLRYGNIDNLYWFSHQISEKLKDKFDSKPTISQRKCAEVFAFLWVPSIQMDKIKSIPFVQSINQQLYHHRHPVVGWRQRTHNEGLLLSGINF